MSDAPPPPPPPPPPSSFGSPPPGGSADVGAALSYGWKKFGQYAGVLIAVIVIPFGVQLLVNLIGYAVVRGFFGIYLFSIIGLVIGAALNIGIFNTALMVTAGETPTVGKAFTTDRWGEWILFAIVFQLFVGFGAIFCGVGALLVLAFFGLAPYYFLDQNMSLGDAFSASLAATRGRSGLPLAIAITALVGVAGFIACYIGALVTLPLAYVGVGFLYRYANNQPAAP